MESKVIFLVIILILLIPYSQGDIGENTAKEHLLIYEASPYPYAKTNMEYVCIFNPLNVKINLNGYFITDFEGKLILHGSITPNSKIYIAQNSSSFLNFMGFYPNYTYAELKEGKFSLANKGDEIALYKGSKMVDMVIYGNSKYNGTGWIGKPLKLTQGHIIRRKNLIDTNTPKDWSTYHIIGQSDFKPEAFKASLEIFPYPDKWKEVLRFTKEAKSKILIESYTMDSLALEKVLEEKLKDGVEVNILLEGSPIGGIKDSEKYILQRLYLKGANIKFMINEPSKGIYDRYTFLHAKFIIVDDDKVLVSTENFGDSSLSPCGNRGYGVIVRNEKFARYMERVFYDDSKNVKDIENYSGYFQNVSLEENRIELRSATFSSVNLTAYIEPLIAPDFSYALFQSFVSGQRDLKIEALYIDNNVWNILKNKTYRALVQYRREGENVRLFDGYEHYIPYLHAKLIIGDSSVLVGSMNFGISSMLRNREVSLIIKSKNAANYLSKIFDYDWDGKYKPIIFAHIIEEKNELTIDLSKSVGNIKDYIIYVDGKKIYETNNAIIHLKLGSGVHKIKIIAIDYWGNTASLEKNVKIEGSTIDPRLIILLVFLAFFLYEIWKNHG